jgi:hypothetical protein
LGGGFCRGYRAIKVERENGEGLKKKPKAMGFRYINLKDIIQ